MDGIHDFDEALQNSICHEQSGIWTVMYQAIFPSMVDQRLVVDDMIKQSKGIDREIDLENGRTITVDEKCVYFPAETFLIELYNDYGDRYTDGWMKKLTSGRLTIDLIAYYRIAHQVLFLIPCVQLVDAWKYNGHKWTSEKQISAPNGKYSTVSTFISTKTLFSVVPNTHVVHFNASEQRWISYKANYSTYEALKLSNTFYNTLNRPKRNEWIVR